MYNAVGMLQRDAVPLAPGAKADTDSNAELRTNLVKDIVLHSKEIDRHLSSLASLPEKQTVMAEIETLLAKLPLAIEQQKERVEQAIQNQDDLEAIFDNLISENLGQANCK
ncbi:hypothetical protein PSACC_01409 [Paramicrosporidium saccamoebae]|uniref:Mediator of RNA polymerase II transcription subunit 21 n=1 Tax=Paramicrosporidium saccamoebae TaxID=1246581 RepID=A0A2H9TM25_9FUNG|nr:hypothetical protein PSACC_01409 [Paramicrosporidium saccamoebae]